MATLKINLAYKDDREYTAVNASGNEVPIDMHPRDEKQAMSPMELLLSGLISCAAVDIALMVKKRRKTLADLKGEVVGNRREEVPKKFTDIHIHYTITSPDLTDQEAERIVSLATTKYCSVAATINESTTITHDFTIVKP